jgi:hypothetical protein
LAALVLVIGSLCPSLPAQAANNPTDYPCPPPTIPYQSNRPTYAAGLLCDGTGAARVSNGGSTITLLNSSSPTTCTSISLGPVRLERVWEAISTEAVTLTLYNEGASPTCSAADVVATLTNLTVTSNTAQPILFDAYLANGLAYKLSGSLTGGVNITRF